MADFLPMAAANSWPDSVDAAALALYALAAFGLPALGYVFMALDIRRYLRSLRRALVVVAAAAVRRGTPEWALRGRPPCMQTFALDLPFSEEQLLAAYTGEPESWGPNDAYPEPQSVFHSTYFDGKTTIAVTQRRLEQKFNFKGSPLQRAGIEISVEAVTSGGKSFSYGTSPEVPPHVFGFLGNTFVLVAGYAPQAELLRVAGGLAETPVDLPADLDASPSPGATGSPAAGTDATPTPAATPEATAGSLPGE